MSCYFLILIIAFALFLNFRKKFLHKNNLKELAKRISPDLENSIENNLLNAETSFDYLSDRLGRAGILGKSQRTKFKKLRLLFFSLTIFLFLVCGLIFAAFKTTILLTLLGIYLSCTAYLLFLKLQTKSQERQCLFQLAIFLESLVLLVESGLGVLPALQKIVKSQDESGNKGLLSYFFKLIYNLTENGLPFSKSLALISEACPNLTLKHILMHLDISNSEGGELIPSLRNLSDYAHNEWKLSVEHRVRRLENLVVFPVFLAVIGLMILSSAVPIVPLLKLKDSLNQRQQLFSSEINPSKEFNLIHSD